MQFPMVSTEIYYIYLYRVLQGWLKNSAIFEIILDIIYLLKSSDIFILDAIIISTVS